MRKVIVTTTINPPTEAIRKFDAMPDWDLIVVGDKKTPADYKLERGLYLTPEMQDKFAHDLSEAIGWNCIQRRNIGFLWAMKEMKAEIVATVDDDNVPYDHWGKNLLIEGKRGDVAYYETDQAAFDPLSVTSLASHLWHRGFPLQLVSRRTTYPLTAPHFCDASVQADFWDGDPDIDAVCRMIYNPVCCKFMPSDFPFMANKISSFNSQNTFLLARVMPHYFMFPGIGRMDDIWASYYVQQEGFKVVYGAASVRQERNPHDLTKDMKAEYLGYEHNLEIVRSWSDERRWSVRQFLPEQAVKAFALYQKYYE